MRRTNPLLDTDSYKFSHYLQYPPNTTGVYSYVESRGGRYDATIFFGLQTFLKRYMTQRITMDDVDDAADFCKRHGEPFNREGFEVVVKDHGGLWPVRIRAVREGTLVPTRNVLVDVQNTDPRCFWATSFLETAIMRAVWYPTTVATREFYLKRVIRSYLERTASPEAMAGLDFKLNDFGSRGASSYETSELGGMAHLAVFKGTDNVPAVDAAAEFYGEPMAGFSIPAAEHSTMTSWGGVDGEIDAMRNMLRRFARPGTLVAVVSDSYDIWRAVRGDKLLAEVRESGATVVIRPDSGDPVETPVDVIKTLMAKIGYVTNSKGYRMLPSYFRVIQGDGVSEDTIPLILARLAAEGLSTDNLAFGMGGAMLQKMDRDTCRFAMKCSAIEVDGAWRDVFKDPVTDSGKVSKKGRLELVGEGDNMMTVRYEESGLWGDSRVQLLETVYEDGRITREQTLSEIRRRIDQAL